MDAVKAPKPKVFFFGCWAPDTLGHNMYDSDGDDVYSFNRELTTPWGLRPDGTLCPEGPQYQGVAKLTQKDGWTAIGFWDRTGDSRGNSNSNFLVRGIYTFEDMCRLASEQYPELWKRIGKVTNGEQVQS